MHKLLIVDDDLHLRRLVKTYAEREDYICEEADSGETALDKLSENEFDLVILDVMMPGIDGFATLSSLRKSNQVPVILLTARGEEYDKLFGFDLGADDYVPKPFSPKELMARVRTVLKRSGKNHMSILAFSNISIKVEAREVYLDEKRLNLPPKEFDLLLALAQKPHIAISREQLLKTVWGYNYFGDARTLDTHVKSLREHLGEQRNIIKTVWGRGYKLEYDEEE